MTKTSLMNINVLLLLIVFFSSLNGQIIDFQQVYVQSDTLGFRADLPHLNNAAFDFADVDGDNDLDLLLSGETLATGLIITSLYLNDGNGNLSVSEENDFIPVSWSCVEFEDYDNDGDFDVIISGSDSNYDGQSKLYENNGNGLFTLIANTPFANIYGGSIKWIDVNNNSYKDIIITGRASSKVSKLYLNNGDGSFTESTDNIFEPLAWSSIDCGDVDNDGDSDLFISGQTNSNEAFSKLYLNNGSGLFEEDSINNFTDVEYSAVSFMDIDNNSSLDLIITGRNNSDDHVLDIFLNDGLGNFSLDNRQSLTGVRSGAIAFSDIDLDSDVDLLVTGFYPDQSIAILYENNGTGLFTEFSQIDLPEVNSSAVGFADLNADNYPDLLLCGYTHGPPSESVTELYKNSKTANFYPSNTLNEFIGGKYAEVKFFDMDGDLDQDLIVTGEDYTSTGNTSLYRNDGTSFYTMTEGHGIPNAYNSSISIFDADSDGDLDIFLAGEIESRGCVGNMLINNGYGVFTTTSNIIDLSMGYASVSFGDIDGDSDIDLSISGGFGAVCSQGEKSIFLLNDGTGNFTQVEPDLVNVKEGSSILVDIDQDNDLDLILSGSDNQQSFFTNLYTNNGNGTYTIDNRSNFERLSNSTTDYSDIDNDGDIDFVISGLSQDDFYKPKTLIYKNDGTGVFEKDSLSQLTGISYGKVKFADIDGDNDPDLLLTGQADDGSNSIALTKVYLNNGSGHFFEFNQSILDHLEFSSLDCTDIDGDNNLDIVISGIGTSPALRISKVFRNLGPTSYTPSSSIQVETHTDSFTWINGITYTESVDTVQFNFVTSLGYDSLVTLDLTIIPSSINNDLSKVDFSVYPNPAKSFVQISSSKKLTQVAISIYDLQGRLILSEKLSYFKEYSLTTEDFAKGSYLLIIQSEESTHKQVLMLE